MIKEKHTLTNPYNHHALSRYIDVYEVTTDGCSSSPMSGYKGTEATLVDDPAWNEKFSSYSITGATLTGNNYVINNDVTAKANYETAKNVTLQTDGHGTIAANKMSGFIGDQVTLSNTANAGYEFTGYSITGATLTGNKFNFIGNNVTARAGFYHQPSAVYFTRASNFTCTSAQGQQQLDINKALTGYNYITFKFNINKASNGNATWAWDFNINFNNGSWNARDHYSLKLYSPYGPVRNGQTFTKVYSGVKSKSVDGKTLYYSMPGSKNYKFVFDRSANDCSAFQYTNISLYLGHGPIGTGVTSLNNFKLVSEAWTNLSANSFYLAGFDDLNAAINY